MVTCYSDVDWCGDKEDQRNISGYFYQVFGAPISWSSRKQLVVALSSCEDKYITRSYVVCQAIWIKSVL